jgi:hypothetical protein
MSCHVVSPNMSGKGKKRTTKKKSKKAAPAPAAAPVAEEEQVLLPPLVPMAMPMAECDFLGSSVIFHDFIFSVMSTVKGPLHRFFEEQVCASRAPKLVAPEVPRCSPFTVGLQSNEFFPQIQSR